MNPSRDHLQAGPVPLSAEDVGSPHDDPRLTQALEEYLAAIEAGAPLSRRDFLARHPEIAEPLDRCLVGLAFIQSAGAQLRSSALGPAGSPVVPIPEVQDGTPLGDFRILREVGRGGMGLVYEAEQLSLGRRVALKVLPFAATLDPRQLQRFKNEAQAAAHLHHGHIVPVHAVGCERGVHYYAMQFINGQTLADLIRELRQRTGRDAGGATAPAEAAADAATQDARAGSLTARATARDPRSAAFFRSVAEWGGQAARALDYAHEQGVVHRDIKPANLLVDGHGQLWITDFGLAQCHNQSGLTLTGDLVGTLRYMSPEQALAQRAVVDHRSDVYSLGVTLYELLTLEPAFGGSDRQELLRQIAFEEPRPPRRRNPALPAELETILLKAMAKVPAERYATARELAEDLQRFLKDEPVRAKRPTLLHRARKWGRRHQPLVWTVGISAVLLLLLSVVVLLVSNVRITAEKEQKERALREKDQALREKDAALATAQANEEAAAADFAKACEAVDRLLTRVSQSQLAHVPQLEQLRKSLLKDALAFEKGFLQERSSDPKVQLRTAAAHARMGGILSLLGEHARAEEASREAITLLERLLADSPSDRFRQASLANEYTNLGSILRERTQLAAAEQAYARALDLWKKLGPSAPKERRWRHLQGNTHNNLGYLLSAQGRSREAEPHHRAALELFQALEREVPDGYSDGLAMSLSGLADVYSKIGRQREAEAVRRQVVARYETIVAAVPLDPWYQYKLAEEHNNLCLVLHANGQAPQAEQAQRRALTLFSRLAQDFPAAPRYRQALATSHHQLGRLFHEAGRFREAEAAYREALAVGKRAASDFPAAVEFREGLAETYINLGKCLSAQGQPREAEPVYRDARTLLRQLAADFPTSRSIRHYLAYTCDTLGFLLRKRGELEQAEVAYREACTLGKQLTADYPAIPAHRSELAVRHNALAGVLQARGQLSEADVSFHEARALLQHLVLEFPVVAEYQNALAGTLVNLAALRRDQKDFPAARTLLEQALPHHQAALKANPQDATCRLFYRNNRKVSVVNLLDLGEYCAAAVAAEEFVLAATEADRDVYDAACFLSRCVSLVKRDDQLGQDKRAVLVESYVRRAVELLRLAAARGCKDAQHLKDKDLDPLRSHEEFKKLLAGIQARSPTP
jgi:serine/threonine protein kinase